MKIIRWDEKSELSGTGTMIEVSKEEALQIIESLSHQMIKKSPNNGRTEMYTSDTQEYFSIAVKEE